MKTEKPENDMCTVRVLAYIIAEVRRQGHEFWRYDSKDPYGILLAQTDGPQRTLWMLEAWEHATSVKRLDKAGKKYDLFTLRFIERIGELVEQEKNSGGFRKVPVWVGGHEGILAEQISSALTVLIEHKSEITPEEFYKQFLEIHPFIDGNGRAAKILYAWLRDELDDPRLPPNFWGCSNP